MIYLISIIYIAIMSIQVPAFIKQKLYKELAVYLAIIVITALYSYSGLEGWNFPSIAQVTEYIFKPASKLIFPRYYR